MIYLDINVGLAALAMISTMFCLCDKWLGRCYISVVLLIQLSTLGASIYMNYEFLSIDKDSFVLWYIVLGLAIGEASVLTVSSIFYLITLIMLIKCLRNIGSNTRTRATVQNTIR